MCSFIKALIYMKRTLSGRLQELKTKEKSSWVIPKVVVVAYGSGRLRELFFSKSQFQWGFAKVVVTRAGCLREWSQRELQLYNFLEVKLRTRTI